MTKQSSFKRAARERARTTGQRYSQARADLELANRQEFIDSRPFEQPALKAHLEEHYEITIQSILPIDDDPATRPDGSWPGHYPSTLVVQHADGQRWIARIFSSPADQVSRVEGDAEVLKFLAAHHFPAERIAHQVPVTVLDGNGIVVTKFIDGGRPSAASAAVWSEMADLLGRLHNLPPAGGAIARDGGAEEHGDGLHVGRPKEDLAAAMSFLVSVEDKITSRVGEKFEWLRDQVENADDAEGLPEAFTHSNYHPWAAVGRPGTISIVGWAGSGRGPRLPALAWLLRTAAERNGADNVAAVVHGYSRQVQLTVDELDRLPSILNMRPLWLECLDLRMAVNNGRPRMLNEGWMQPSSHEFTKQLTDRVAQALQNQPPEPLRHQPP